MAGKSHRTAAEAFLLAYKDWSNLDIQEKIRIACATNKMYPKTVVNWKDELEFMQENPHYVPSSVACHLGNLSKPGLLVFINTFVARHLQEDNTQNLESLRYEGKPVELAEDLRQELEEFRKRNT